MIKPPFAKYTLNVDALGFVDLVIPFDANSFTVRNLTSNTCNFYTDKSDASTVEELSAQGVQDSVSGPFGGEKNSTNPYRFPKDSVPLSLRCPSGATQVRVTISQ